MAGRMIEFTSEGNGPVPGYLAVPPSGTGPGVIVVQEWWGLVPHIRAVADRLAAAGCTALAPDLYHGRQVGLDEPDEAGKAMMALDATRAAREMAGAVEELLRLPEVSGEGVGAIGFCMGGGLAVQLATVHPAVVACVDYYGIPAACADLGQIRGPVLGHFADHDDIATPAAVRALAERLTDAEVTHQFHTYPDAGHAFFNDERPGTYRAAAAELSWERTLAFLRAELGAPRPRREAGL